MAKNSIRDFDNTAGNNTDIQSVDIAENCAPSGINNAIRELMADMADVNDGTVALVSPAMDSADINGGTIDGTVIGGTTPAAGTFTTGDFNTSLNVDGTITSDGLTVDGTTTIGNATYGSSLGQFRIINDASSAPASLSLFGHNDVSDGTDFAKIEFAMQTAGTGGNVVSQITSEAEGTSENAAHLTFETASGGSLSEVMRLTSDGSVGINETNPSFKLDVANVGGDAIRINAGADFSGLRLTSTAGEWAIRTSVADQLIFYDVSASQTRMTLDSSGNLLVGKESSDMTTTGSEVQDGAMRVVNSSTSTNLATNSGASLLLANPSSTDGNFSNIGSYNTNQLVDSQINFIHESHSSRTGAIGFSTHDGSSLGEVMRVTSGGSVGIGTSSPAYKLDVASAVIQFGDSTDAFAQYKSSAGNWHVGANSSNAFAFYSGTYGSGTERLRIQSGGGISFNGDTAAANALDDYEEGTWTPTTASGTLSVIRANYTKIGRQVNLNCTVQFTIASSSSNGFVLEGLPFSSTADVEFIGAVMLNGQNVTTTSTYAYIYGGAVTDSITVYQNQDNAGVLALPYNAFAASEPIYISITYTTH